MPSSRAPSAPTACIWTPAKDLAAAYEAARGILGPSGMIGVDPGISRHDAMTLAEAGADYIAFGAPAHLKDRDKARARRDELLAWWAEIFQVPCVAFDVETAQEAEALAGPARTSWREVARGRDGSGHARSRRRDRRSHRRAETAS